MNATARRIDELLVELRSLDVRLTPTGDGNLTIDAPDGILRPVLIERLRQCKADLLARLQRRPETSLETGDDEGDVGRVDADAESLSEYEAVQGWNGCAKCGRLDAWLSCAGDRFGRTPGRWRCSTCDPPNASRRMRAAAERIRVDAFRK